ncbi:MAG TPA: tRNA preQ1(34) S-adenosylmethionine ribosyltransferase-isomerase QueA [Acidobacteriaceae bacterium]|nr:tRNA preQ1(34) S-adenosylmethionine ribosyltransferase-isomerase QueA [Acidobacteriaceae bacterium]
MPVKINLVPGSGLVTDFDYPLPPEQIAQEPLADRAASRMLVFDRATGAYADASFRDLPQRLQPGDLLVLNNSRVIPARLFARRGGLHAQPVSAKNPTAGEYLRGRMEVLLTTQHAPLEWSALVRPGRKLPVGEKLLFYFEEGADASPTPLLEAEITGRGEFGERRLRFAPVADFYAVLDRLGRMPLPPYIHRNDAPADRERYQTVYAQQRGSVAAPTAGLHFTPEVLDAIRARGVEIAYVTLHVGLGTFQPVRVARVDEIVLHTERYTLPAETAQALNRAQKEGRRVVAAGTTTVRTLEHCALQAADGDLQPHSGETNIFIAPGFRFRLVGGLLTNFHLPQSTLLMLVCAFGGQRPVLAAYNHAVRQGYRFFSYGDCMFLA